MLENTYEYKLDLCCSVGIVRKALGLTFLGETRDLEEQFTIGDIHLGVLTTDVCAILHSHLVSC